MKRKFIFKIFNLAFLNNSFITKLNNYLKLPIPENTIYNGYTILHQFKFSVVHKNIFLKRVSSIVSLNKKLFQINNLSALNL